MINILHMLPFILNSRLGTRTRLQSLIEKSACQHWILSTPWPGMADEGRQEHGSNWQIDSIWGEGLLTVRGAKYLSWFPLCIQVTQAIHRHKIAVIHAHNPNLLSQAAADVARAFKLPLIYEPHGLVGTDSRLDGRYSIKARHTEGRLARQADAVLVQTRVMKVSLLELYSIAAEKVNLLPNFVDVDWFDPQCWQGERDRLRKEWDAGEEEVIFLYSGFINWYNGIPELLQAYATASFSRPARLLVCGDGDLVPQVRYAERESLNPVHYLGLVDSASMPAIYAATDCLVLARPDVPETREATPMKLLEAMAMRKIVICSRVAGMTQVADEQSAIFISPGNTPELTTALESVVRNSTDYLPLGRKARMKITEQFGIEASVRNLDEIYRRLA